MGTQKERTRSTKPNRRKRLHREDRGRRLRLRLYTNVHDTPDTSRTTNVTTKLDSATIGDVSTAFLHAPIAKDHDGKQRDVYLWPKELCPQQDKVWRLKKAMYGLRSSPNAWQDYLAEVLQKLSFVRLKSEPNVYTSATRDCYIMVYVDDLLVLGDKTTVDSTFEAIQKQVLLKHRLPRTWQTTKISWKKHRPLWQLLQPGTRGLLHRQHDRGVWNEQLQLSEHSRNCTLQTNNRR